MKNIFSKLEKEENIEPLIRECLETLFIEGSVDFTVLEIISYVKFYWPIIFKKYEKQILIKMGLFFKPLEIETFEDNVFKLYYEHIKNELSDNFTPTQADVIYKISQNKVFSFSSPTSTGKSFIFRYLLTRYKKDIVIIVPSRALINEYYKRVSEVIVDKNVNVLTFVDKINTKRANRNIFIITPERTKDLFILRNEFDVDLILFDEAQLSDEDSIRGMYYDSVVRRAVKYFENSKLVFAYPFVSNPNVQFSKNHINIDCKDSFQYEYKNVGQIFYSYDEKNNFYSFGIENKAFGNKKQIDFDPLEKVLAEGGTALIYCAKRNIYNKKVFNKYEKYLKFCTEIESLEAKEIIENIRIYIGASDKNDGDYRSLLINFLKRGIVIHHGSLPLRVRILVEEFTQKGFCQLCFATATLEQGINMPFDLVWIEKFEPSKCLSVKNLIGRAGRSTSDPVFDFGQIVIKDSSRIKLSKIVKDPIVLDVISQLDIVTDPNDDYREYKESIKEGTFSEEYNLTNSEIERLRSSNVVENIEFILSQLFKNEVIDFSEIKVDEEIRGGLINAFIQIYKIYLNRELSDAEKYVLTTTIKILFWRVQGKRFNQIVQYRYAHASQIRARESLLELLQENKISKFTFASLINGMEAEWLTMFQMIPNKNLNRLNINHGVKAVNVDFDAIVVDTYDYIDKLIGFRLGDVYFAAFDKFSKNDTYDYNLRLRAEKITKYIKFGTDNDKEIWLLRYGFEFEDFDWLLNHVEFVNEKEIVFKNISELNEEQLKRISKFV